MLFVPLIVLCLDTGECVGFSSSALSTQEDCFMSLQEGQRILLHQHPYAEVTSVSCVEVEQDQGT